MLWIMLKKKILNLLKNLSNIFKKRVRHLKFCDKPVVSAPSGLTLGGGAEVLLQSNFVVSHTNLVIGLVETIVGFGSWRRRMQRNAYGGGLKQKMVKMIQIMLRLKVFDIIGYAKTASSPDEALPLLFMDKRG